MKEHLHGFKGFKTFSKALLPTDQLVLNLLNYMSFIIQLYQQLLIILLQMKIGNFYNLATNYQLYRSHIKATTQENLQNSTFNIFNSLDLRKYTNKELIPSKSYQIVGMKQLRSLELRARKGTKFTIKRDSTYRERPDSKSSHHHKDSDLLTKQQVLEGLPKIQRPNNKAKLKKAKKQSWVTEFTDRNNCSSDLINITTTSRQAKQFSVVRLKNIMKEREKQWQCAQQKCQKQNEKFPSIYKSTDLYRQKIEQRQKMVKTQEMANQRSNLWQGTLRNQIELKELVDDKVIVKTLNSKEAFTARGVSKIRLQKQWLQRKEEEGYRFKILGSTAAVDDAKIQNFR